MSIFAGRDGKLLEETKVHIKTDRKKDGELPACDVWHKS